MSKKTSTKTVENPRDAAVTAALALAAERGWGAVTLRDVAAKAGLEVAALHDIFADRYEILGAFGRMIDRRVLTAMEGVSAEGSSPRDRLFDIMMERFDALNDHRDGVCAILDSFAPDPKQIIIGLPHLCRSMAWMLDMAGIETGGLRGMAKVMGLTLIYLDTVRTWKNDQSVDLSATMAALDNNLARVEVWAERLF